MKKTMAIIMIAISICATIPVFTSCSTSAQKTAYKVEAVTLVTVEEAVKMYNVIASQGKTTVRQNLAVKEAYNKYQVTFAVVCDAGAAYAAANASNIPANVSAASSMLQQAINNSSTSINDILNLIKAYGVKL